RCRFWFLERLRGAMQHASGGTSGGGWIEVQPIPHHCTVFTYAPSIVNRAQPSLGRDGWNYGNRKRLAWILFSLAEHLLPDCQDTQAEWLRHRPIRQVP